jgi:hydroxymethylpyrimidine/phosphomethylpyrimidine kinase
MSPPVPTVLSIAGSDPSGGAGIQGDLKTFAALRVHGCAVVTALTAQNSRVVRNVWPVPADVVAQQLTTLLEDVEVHAVKIGMLADSAIVRAVAGVLRQFPGIPIVLDPVLRASVGGALLEPSAVSALLDELVPMATVITPNTSEAGSLTGEPAPASLAAAGRVAQLMVARGANAALVTGGHFGGSVTSVDVLATPLGVETFTVARIAGGGAHGSGCALSSAIAALLARGYGLSLACAEAQQFVARGIRDGQQPGTSHGVQPIHSLGGMWAALPLADQPSRITLADIMSDAAPILLRSELTCPHCGHRDSLTMPTDACLFFHECVACHTVMRPRAGDCCVFCSYGSVVCPPMQNGSSDCCATTASAIPLTGPAS